MPDPRLEKLADLLVNYSLEVKAGDLMRLRGSSIGEPLAVEVFRAAVKLGAHPFFMMTPAEATEIYLRDAPEEALDYLSPLELLSVEHIDVDFSIFGDYNSYSLAGVDPARLARFQKVRGSLFHRYLERSDAGELRWCGAQYPSQSAAQDAKMSLRDYENFVYGAMLLDKPDPVAAWREVAALQKGYCDYLQSKQQVRIVAEDTDLTIGVGGRTWISADGKRNMPDGEVFTGPVENSANGHIRYSFPTIYNGRGAEDVQLWFEDGVVVRWEAREGRELLDELFAMDDGARRLGELAIGTNYGVPTFTKNILFDEKIGGTCHLAVGASYPSTGGINESALHWDMVCDLRSGGALYADGELFHENGQWKI